MLSNKLGGFGSKRSRCWASVCLQGDCFCITRVFPSSLIKLCLSWPMSFYQNLLFPFSPLSCWGKASEWLYECAAPGCGHLPTGVLDGRRSHDSEFQKVHVLVPRNISSKVSNTGSWTIWKKINKLFCYLKVRWALFSQYLLYCLW